MLHSIVAAARRRPCPPALTGVLVLSLFVAPAAAADDGGGRTEKLDPVAVIATRGAQPIADLLADVTVIDAEEIARAGVHGLADLLRRQPGIEITRNGGPAGVSGVFIRGANRGQTLVLVDGQRVGSASTGATTLEAIPLEAIERIEILRGPASSLYGADAIGGVIQIFTYGASATPQATVSASVGSYATRALNALIGGSAGPLRLSLQAAALASDGFNAASNPAAFNYNPDADGYRSGNATVDLALPLADGHELAAKYLYNRQDAQYDGSAGFDDRTVTTLETWQIASRNRLAPFWASRLTAGQSSDDSVSKTEYGDFPFGTRQTQLAWQNDFTLPQGLLTAGYEFRKETVSTDVAFAVTSRDTNSVFAIYQWRDAVQALQANLRWDDSSQYGGKATGALAYGYRVMPSLRLTTGASTGFKPPSFNDLYYPGFSTPDLAPETAVNLEAGAHWTGTVEGGTVGARAVVYRNAVDQLIVFRCDASFNCKPGNVDQATLTGLTLALDATFGTLSLAGSIDLGNPRDDATGNLLPRRAREHGALSLAQTLGPVRVGAELAASSYRYDDAANTVRLPGYTLVNLTLEWTPLPAITVFVRADNVFNVDYSLAADYSTGGAMVTAGLRWRV
jgi:vitamin B12 transporter